MSIRNSVEKLLGILWLASWFEAIWAAENNFKWFLTGLFALIIAMLPCTWRHAEK